ncbi:MAG TPA: tetratricopeptide repeat protein, partial [Luteolibacter sp.]|nr:tetratricopeptide repeat protein [Luteolibacter sp.]
DLGNGREALLRRAVENVSFGKSGRMPWQAVVHPNQFAYHQEQTRKQAGALITKLGERLKADAAKGEIQPTILGMWFNTVDTRQPAAQEIMRTLFASKAYEKLDPAYREAAADSRRFGALASAPDPMLPAAISRELVELADNAAPAQVEAAFATVMARAASAPQVVTVIGLTPVAKLPEWKPETRRLVLSLFREQAALGKFPANQGYEALVERLARDFRAEGAITGIETHAAGLWHAAACDDARGYRAAAELATCITHALKSNAPSIAMTLARTAQKSAIQQALSTSNQEPIKQLWGLIGRSAGEAAIAIGAVDIPVNESDPNYPIHQSHSEFVLGNLDTAWSIYVKHADKLSATLRSLSPEYGLWLLEKAITADDTRLAESLIKDLTIWSRDAEGSFSLEQQAALKIAYADLALRKGALPTARAWYRKIADAAEYRGTASHLRAALGSVRVDRLSKNFSGALDELEKLMRLPDPDFRMKVRYARAEVMMDQENYAEALEELEAVLRREAKHPDALILRGKIHYQMRKLVEASEIEIGPSQNETVLVPGKALKINLRDPSLQVSGLGADIEVEIRTTSGDVERLLLHQFGDTKDKFRAEITTALGAPVHDDKILQVLGKDEIRYGYSQRFRQRMKDLPPDPQDVITVASDAELALSAGSFPPREGERKLDVSELGLSTAQAALGTRAVRPGNPVYLRVIDPDHSFTPGIDEIHLDLVASSGDVIRKLALKETAPYSGEFQAIVPTATAQPSAFASESSPGRDPNMTISPLEHPGWQGEVGNAAKQRTFGVDLNDNVPVKEMLVDGGAKGNTLSKVVVQTSMNGITWTSCGRFPEEKAPWDGRPQFTSMPTYIGGLSITNPPTRDLPREWIEKLELGTMGKNVGYLSAYATNLKVKDEHLVGTGHPDYGGLFRFRAVFHQPTQAIRTLRVVGAPAKDDQGGHSTIFLLDGKPADAKEADHLTIQRELKPGLHTIEVWTHMGRGKYLQAQPKLQCDAPGKTELIDCPDEMFDITKFPAEASKDLPQHATVTAEGNGLRIRFGEHAQARMVRLVIGAFSSDAPMISKVTLDDREGKKRLPVAVDYQQLRDNQQLEVLPGDSITARYEDPVSATPKRNKHEKALGVAFNTGTITSSFLDYEVNKQGERTLKLEPIRRFRLDDAVAIVIEDADLDSSSENDTIECLITSDDGRKTTIKALETEPNSGRFIGRVFPVEGQPSRDSEIQIKPGGFITASYLDAENLDPGIPTQRKVSISHALFSTPKLEAYTASSEAVTPPPAAKPAVKAKPKDGNPTAVRTGGPEVYEIRRALSYQHVPTASLEKTKLESLLNASVHFDVIVPHLALAQSSEIQAYVQTDAARKAAGVADGNFELTVPGTLKFKGQLGQAGAVVPLGYELKTPPHAPTQSSPLEEGRFSFAIPLILGDPPARSFATKSAAELPQSEIPDGLAVKAGDIIHIGFPWQDEKKEIHWIHLSFVVGGHAILDVMEGGYQQALTSAFVGEKVHLRMIAPNLDLGSGQDKVEVELTADSGVSARYALQETESHSGIFKSSFTISYATNPMPPQLPPVALNGLPVKYGDRITVRYQEQSFGVDVSKGADGLIEPFSKRFTGDEMAVRTSFTLAECYFELAKKHREMDQESLARREIAQARKLLAEALATHRDENLKAHAEYLLGNLAQEYADLSKNEESKLPMYQDALARFIKIPTDYPESEFAPKAQFKTALVYEKMGEIDNAVEEYVKLAYKYPDNELIPTVMSRLGGYFQQKGQQFKEKADPLREKKDDASVAEVLRLDQLSYPEFLKAAMVFSKLQARFPDDPLAGMAGLRAGQNLMRAHKYERAIEQFKAVMDNPQYD